LERNSQLRIVSVGEVLWDVFDHGEFFGGAPLNFSATSRRLGNSVALVTGLGADERGRRALAMMKSLSLPTDFVQIIPGQETGVARVSVDSSGNAKFVIPRPAAFDSLAVDDALLSRIEHWSPEWIYYGTLAQTEATNAALVEQIFSRSPAVQGFYDMNLRDGHWGIPLVRRLSKLATVIKVNEIEAETLFALTAPAEIFSLEKFCRLWSAEHEVELICVTLGGEGCAIFYENSLELFAGFSVEVVDTVGAGDAFAAAFLHGLQQDWPMARTARFANALGGIVASRAGAVPKWTMEECLEMSSA
jgi:fructokinase